MTALVQAHAHAWYPISHDTSGRGLVFACGVYYRCIQTATPTMKGQGTSRGLVYPEPQMPRPTGGLWGD